ncbi:hypothetical protein [Clostridium sediminicola]|uniref:hypothetical protein n=1 Tax=Clostridium sediminicola TaxID=3114879 RepID=UPI003D18197C
MVNIYLVLLIFMIVLSFEGIKVCNRSSPHKIKIFANIVYVLVFFRFLSLMLLFFASDLKYLFVLKPIFFINYLAIIAVALTVIYIFIRNDKINFTYAFFVLGIFAVIYSIMIYKCSSFIITNTIYGYITEFYNFRYVNFGYFLLMACVMIIILTKYDKFRDKFGINICIGAVLMTLLELSFSILNIRIFPHIILSDICWVFVLNYAISKFKKS